MLMEYGFRNFLSFKEGVSVSFRLDGNVPAQISGGRDFATVMCVKGANGSGKTHLLKGLSFLTKFMHRSFSSEPEAKIDAIPFNDSKEPSAFYAEFRIADTTYRYEVELNQTRVVGERLFRTKQRKTLLFEREGDAFKTLSNVLKGLTSVKLRQNASVISIARHHEIKALDDLYKATQRCLSNVIKTGMSDRAFMDIYSSSEILSRMPELLEFVTDFIKECDVGVTNIRILSEEKDDGSRRFFPVFDHRIGETDLPVHVSTESSGTKQLYRYLLAYGLVLKTGSLIVVDEFDLYLHPAILPKLINLFLDGESNKRGAQLLFTTQHSNILEICGRYRTYLVNKQNNASFAYRLDEIPGDILRNDRSIVQPYEEGRIGGVPRL